MTDPLSTTAGVVGITVAALHGIRLLIEDLQQLKEAPKTIKRLLADMQSVETSLKLLQGVGEREWDLLGASILEDSKTTISSCMQACRLFKSDLQRWTRHSEGGKLTWQDRASVGFFKQGQVKAMSEQLQNCKLSINLVISIGTLYSSVRHTHITEEVRKTMSLVRAEVKGAITTTDKQLVALESRLKELDLSSDDEDEEEAGADEGKAGAIQQLEEERKALEASRTLLDKLISKAQEDAVAKATTKSQDHSTTVTTVTFGDGNSGLQTGVLHGGVHGAVFGGK